MGAAAEATTILLLLVTAAAPRSAGGTEYTVGDSGGWTIGPNYLTWSQRYNFTAGDTLVFNYVPRQHDVYQVTQDAFRTCDPAADQTLRAWASGRDHVGLPAPGDYYFICNVTGHCLGGMKFAVAVGAPTPPPPPPPSPPPPAFPTTTPPLPPSSGAFSGRLAWPHVARISFSCLALTELWISLLS